MKLQVPIVTSEENRMDASHPETIDQLNTESFRLRHDNTKQSASLAEKAIVLARASNYPKGEADALLNKGFHEFVVSKYKEAFASYTEALLLFRSLENATGISHANYNIGLIYLRLGDFEAAMEVQLESYKIRMQLGDKVGIASCKAQLGYLNSQFGLNEASHADYLESLRIWKELGNKAGIGNVLMSMGVLLTKQNKLAEAKKYLEESLAIRTSIKEMNGMHGSANYLSAVYLLEGKYQEALDLLLPALAEAIGQEHPFIVGISRLQLSIAKVYAAVKDYPRAFRQIEDALKSAEASGQQYQLHDLYFELSSLYKSMGAYDKALENYELFHSSKEALLNLNAATRLKNLEVMNTVKLRENEIEIHRLRNIELKERNRIIRNERKKSDALLLNILPKQTAAELKRYGKTKPRQYKMVSVLFSDFVHFTQTAEKLTPEELVHRIDQFFKAFDAIIAKHSIEKIKTIGDSYMAAAGLPEINESHPIDLVRAGLQILDHVREINDPLFNIRIGIHTGPLVAGVVGSKKFAYDIWGDTVNIASRMESSGESGRLNISGTTYELIREHFDCEYRGKVSAKNKGIIEMYFVNGVK